MSLKETATETLRILDAGYFLAPDGRRVDLQPALSEAVAKTRLYTPEQASAALERLNPASAHQ